MLSLRHRILQRGYLAYSRWSRGMTLGVRALLIRDGEIVLVQHSYMPGWYLPGGGVEAGETFGEALEREISEEAGAVLTRTPELFGLYRNGEADPRDHVALFVCRGWDQPAGQWSPSREIVDMRRFPVADLPAETTRATRARLAEVLSGQPVSADW